MDAWYLWVLDSEHGKAYKFTTTQSVVEDADAIDELLFDALGFDAGACQWMASRDGKVYEDGDAVEALALPTMGGEVE